MKFRHRNNIIILIFIHLLLIVYPLVSKSIHVHQGENVHDEFSANIRFEQSKDICPVCNFEFYNSIGSTPFTMLVDLQTLLVINTPVSTIHYGQIIHYFSLRAPPVA